MKSQKQFGFLIFVTVLFYFNIFCESQVTKGKSFKQSSLHLKTKMLFLKKNHLFSQLCFSFDFPVGNIDGKGPYISLIDGKTYPSWNVSYQFAVNYSLGIHPGEDWGGSGPSDSDLGQPVYSIAKGVVVNAEDYFPPWGNILRIRHIYKQNNKIDTVFSTYIHLKKMYVHVNDFVNRRDSIGTIGDGGVYRPHLHFEIRKNSLKNYGANFWPSSWDKDMKWVVDNYESPGNFIIKHRNIR